MVGAAFQRTEASRAATGPGDGGDEGDPGDGGDDGDGSDAGDGGDWGSLAASNSGTGLPPARDKTRHISGTENDSLVGKRYAEMSI